MLCILTEVLFLFGPIEFRIDEIQYRYVQTIFNGAIVAFILALIGYAVLHNMEKSQPNFYRKFLWLSMLFVGSYCGLFFYFLFEVMCGHVITEELFINRTNPSIKIVTRAFGCGATDSTPSTHSTVKIHEFGYLFMLVSEQKEGIDLTKWKSTNEEFNKRFEHNPK